MLRSDHQRDGWVSAEPFPKVGDGMIRRRVGFA